MNDDKPSPLPSLASIAVLVPVWQPDAGFVELVAAIAAEGFGAVVVVNDGSGPGHASQFAEVARLPRVSVLHHAVNLGKGRALKTGINQVLAEMPEIQGLVTADADGQHRVSDIVAVARKLQESKGAVVMGSRSFSGQVPLRSRIGNGLTRLIFGFMTGTSLLDTQTGLRAFPRGLLPELMTLSGERYEYEMTALAHLCQRGKPVEVPIETVYIQNNRSSHFDPVWDSMRIYFVLVRFYFSAVVAAGIDFAGFSLAYAATHNVAVSVAVGRLSSLVNFALNKRFVFRSGAPVKGTLVRYYLLVALIGGLSYAMIWCLARYLHWNVFVAKLAVDTLLSLVSFSVQRTFVFRRSEVT